MRGIVGCVSRPLFVASRSFTSLPPVDVFVKEIKKGNPRFVSRAITFGESTIAQERKFASQMIGIILKEKKAKSEGSKSLRIGISGPPGVGKSSLIEEFGMKLIGEGHKVGVLAVDPSSNRSGGSILGDKTRMPRLAVAPEAFIRPSPSRGYLGGVAQGTHSAIHILEAAGYDRILVETVGVGQSEVHVDSMVDLFLLLLPPAGGDELQGIKKGVVELADILAITKADGELLNTAKHARAEYANAITLLRPKSDYWKPKAIICSSRSKGGLDTLLQTIEYFHEKASDANAVQSKRESQAVDWMWRLIEENLIQRVKGNPNVHSKLPEIVAALKNGDLLAEDASEEVLNLFLHKEL